MLKFHFHFCLWNSNIFLYVFNPKFKLFKHKIFAKKKTSLLEISTSLLLYEPILMTFLKQIKRSVTEYYEQ